MGKGRAGKAGGVRVMGEGRGRGKEGTGRGGRGGGAGAMAELGPRANGEELYGSCLRRRSENVRP